MTSPSALSPARSLDPPSAPSEQQIRTLVLNAVEAVYGMRALEPLAKFVTSETYERLVIQRTLRLERKAVYGDQRRIVPMPGRVIVCMPNERVLNATVIVHTGPRSMGVVVRLEWFETRWRASELALI